MSERGTARPPRTLLVFLDGVGIGPADPAVNPFFAARLPVLQCLSGGRLAHREEPSVTGPHGAAFPLDAGLEVPGTPQSGTGQAALLTGMDAGVIFGGHFGPWIPVRLRPLVEHQSALKRLADAGRSVAFANAYPRSWPGPRGSRGIAGPPLAARGAGVLNRHEEALAEGMAVASEILNDGWREHLGHRMVPRIDALRAGRNLARIAVTSEVTLFAHYGTDVAGHRKGLAAGVKALELVDRFLEGVLEELAADTLLLVTSDHGNVEDLRQGHTRNPALGIAWGHGFDRAASLRDLREVVPFLVDRHRLAR